MATTTGEGEGKVVGAPLNQQLDRHTQHFGPSRGRSWGCFFEPPGGNGYQAPLESTICPVQAALGAD
jgi:hypothetical protein